MPKPTDPDKWRYQFSDDMTFSQKIVLIDPDTNNFLVMKRSPKSNNPEFWDLPGGNMLYGELHNEALLREIYEETGIKILSKPTPIIVTSRFIKNEENDQEIFRLFIGYKATTSKKNIILSSEHTEYKWVSLSEFLDMQAKEAIKDVARSAFE
jgi:8-oxo-dGTP diphosphatase